MIRANMTEDGKCPNCGQSMKLPEITPSQSGEPDFVCLKEPRCKSPCGNRNCHIASVASSTRAIKLPVKVQFQGHITDANDRIIATCADGKIANEVVEVLNTASAIGEWNRSDELLPQANGKDGSYYWVSDGKHVWLAQLMANGKFGVTEESNKAKFWMEKPLPPKIHETDSGGVR